MGRDYKYRANQNKKKPQQTKVTWWKWVLILILISLFVVFLNNLRTSSPKLEEKQSDKTTTDSKKSAKKTQPKNQNKKPQGPRYDFYTILPETEVIIPDYEIKTRSREEQFGKGKNTKYLLQAGSFREFDEADKLRAQLALMGIESRVEKATIGSVVWNRVKIGPYSQSSSVTVIKRRLRNKGIDVVVTEIKG